DWFAMTGNLQRALSNNNFPAFDSLCFLSMPRVFCGMLFLCRAFLSEKTGVVLFGVFCYNDMVSWYAYTCCR
ncbi:MAG: hypothetical protein ACI4PL_07940, partial [Faecousia sp.]